MNVSIIETSGLGDHSYMVSEDDVAVVIDPQRDIDRVYKLAAELGLRITHVLETHIHNDYVTGGLELSRVARAEYAVPAGDHVDYPRRAISDGDIIDAGPFHLEAIHTPGHTHHPISYVLRDRGGLTLGVFTGGSMLHGTTGRTDLLGDEHTLDLTLSSTRCAASPRSYRTMRRSIPPMGSAASARPLRRAATPPPLPTNA